MPNEHIINAGIVGGTGYAGAELLRLLSQHSNVRLTAITSRQESGQSVADVFPHLRGRVDLQFSEPNVESLADCDVVFFATPHAAAMHFVPELIEAGKRVIDLSADFRLTDPSLWAQWYGEPHACPELIETAVYGLPEINREKLAGAPLVACPGCYPTAIILGFLPLLESAQVDLEHLIADAKTGVSGAGRTTKIPFLFGEMSESFKAYGVAGHRHLPEIQQILGEVARQKIGLTFVPHLAPMVRGIHATLYARLAGAGVSAGMDLQTLYEQRYAHEPFVDVLPAGMAPETRSVRGANDCRIAVYQPGDAGTAVVLSVIDNLVKGAAGQAVQCMNLVYGLDESLGLHAGGLVP